jgi:integrase
MSRRRRKTSVGCSVGRRSDGSLRLRFRWKGRDKSIATGLADSPENWKQLRRLADVVGACIKIDKDPTPIIADAFGQALETNAAASSSAPTVRGYTRQWTAQQKHVVRKALAKDYQHHSRHWIERLGDLLMSELRPLHIRGLQAELLSKGLSTKTVKNIISGSFRAMIQQAVVGELVTRDLFLGLKWPKWRPPEPDPFTPGERDGIIDWFRTKRFGFHAGPKLQDDRLRPHPPFHVYVHLLFFSGLRPSEASGLQWGDIDLNRGRLHVTRSRHLYEYGAPKTASADRWVQLFPQTVELLRFIQPLVTTPEMPVFTTTTLTPIEPKTFSAHWYRCLRALGIRQRGLYCTKDTFVTMALSLNAKIAWLEAHTGVSYATLRKHYGRWLPSGDDVELRRFEEVAPGLFNPHLSHGVSDAPSPTRALSR